MKTRGSHRGLRPVGARALKSAGDTLRPHLQGARVLDLFAGQGRFGQMALEEGARDVVFVESDRPTAEQLQAAVAKETGRARVFVQDVFGFLQGASEDRFGVVFADPPFADWNEKYSERLADCVAKVMETQSFLLLKLSSRVLPFRPSPFFSFWKQSRFGESTLVYYACGPGGETRQ